MRRRDFIAVVGGAVAMLPLSVRAQRATMPVVGFLNGASPELYKKFLREFRRGLLVVFRPAIFDDNILALDKTHFILPGRSLHGKIAGFLAFENSIDVAGRSPDLVVEIWPIRK